MVDKSIHYNPVSQTQPSNKLPASLRPAATLVGNSRLSGTNQNSPDAAAEGHRKFDV
jgi:hypothetical protein